MGDHLPVLIASGSPAYARGLMELLSDAGIESVAVSTIAAAVHDLHRRHADVVIVDEALADGPGVELEHELRGRRSCRRVLRVCRDDDLVAQTDALTGRSVDGTILTGWTGAQIIEALRDVQEAPAALDGRAGCGGEGDLTRQERVVLRLMRQHLTYKEIAAHLGVSWHTVRTHAQSILRKTGVHSRRDLLHRSEPSQTRSAA